jgi:MFS family permease
VFGTQLTTVAVPYQVYQLTRSSLDVGLVSLAQLFPLIGGALLGGSVVDAMDRRRLLMVVQGSGPRESRTLDTASADRDPVSGALAWAREILALYTGVSDTSNNAQDRA